MIKKMEWKTKVLQNGSCDMDYLWLRWFIMENIPHHIDQKKKKNKKKTKSKSKHTQKKDRDSERLRGPAQNKWKNHAHGKRGMNFNEPDTYFFF